MIDYAFQTAEKFFLTHAASSYKGIDSLSAAVDRFREWMIRDFGVIPTIRGSGTYRYWDGGIKGEGKTYTMHLSFYETDFRECLERALEDLTMARYRLSGGEGRNTQSLIREIWDGARLPFISALDIREIQYERRILYAGKKDDMNAFYFRGILTNVYERNEGVPIRIALEDTDKNPEFEMLLGLKEIVLPEQEVEKMRTRLTYIRVRQEMERRIKEASLSELSDIRSEIKEGESDFVRNQRKVLLSACEKREQETLVRKGR